MSLKRLLLFLLLCSFAGMLFVTACSNDQNPSQDGSTSGTESNTQSDASTQPEPSVEKSTTPEPSAPEPRPEPAAPEPAAPEPKPPAAPYKITPFDRTRINSRGKVNVRTINTALAFKDGPFAKVKMIVNLESSCYPFSKWASNRPPAGQNWPADCDAYDRNFEISLNPPKDKAAPPGIELVRAITPFGGPMQFEKDVTDIVNSFKPGATHTLRVHITTYSDGKGRVSGSNGGWWVTVRFEVTPGKPPRKVLAVIPLVYHSYKDNTGAKVATKFTVPKGTYDTKIEYRVTGHGGGKHDSACIGHADEFCRRKHNVYVDGKVAASFIPWRSDCQKLCTKVVSKSWPFNGRTYCKENPCGSIRSVEAPRANWCPGSVTPPVVWRFTPFRNPGEHEFAYNVEKVAKGGSWKVSILFFAYGYEK